MARRSPSSAFQARLEARIRRQREQVEGRVVPRFAKAMSAYFADEAQKLARKLVARGILNETDVKVRTLPDGVVVEWKEAATATEFSFAYLEWDAENRELRDILRKEYINLGETVYGNVGQALGVEVAFDLNARNSKEMLNAIGPLVKGINDESRDRLKTIVKTGIDNGDSPAQIAKTMLGSTQGWAGLEDLTKSRAMTIARTETAHAYTMSSISAYEDSGIIKKVICLDSPDCGWRGHNDPELANGTERDFREARLNPTSHPNCVRAFAPKVAGRTDQLPQAGTQRAEAPAARPTFKPDEIEPWDWKGNAKNFTETDYYRATAGWQETFAGNAYMKQNPDSPAMRAMSEAIMKSPKVGGPVYKGVYGNWESQRIGSQIDFQTFSSTSPNLDRAVTYANGKTRTVFEIIGGDAHDIAKYATSVADEAVLEPSSYIVEAIRQQKVTGPTTVVGGETIPIFNIRGKTTIVTLRRLP